MAIIFTGTTITAVKYTTIDIDKVVHTGTTVFTSGPLAPIWVLIYEETSEPAVDLGVIESSSDPSYWLSELTAFWPPYNYLIGETACVWDGYSTYYVYQIQLRPVVPKKWVYIYWGLSQPDVDLGFIESSGSTDTWLGEITMH